MTQLIKPCGQLLIVEPSTAGNFAREKRKVLKRVFDSEGALGPPWSVCVSATGVLALVGGSRLQGERHHKGSGSLLAEAKITLSYYNTGEPDHLSEAS